MRSDMKDLIVNTGRGGDNGGKGPWNRARVRRADPDDLPLRLPIGRHRQFGWNAKSLGDRIDPLRRFLESNVGRPWDDVYSEICEHADSRTVRGYHLRQHVWSEVDLVPDPDGSAPWGLYVDQNGILQDANPRPRFRWSRKPTTKLSYGDPDLYYEKVDGFWYSFQTLHVPDSYCQEWLAMESGEVIIKRKLDEFTRNIVVKKQVDAETAKKLSADADTLDEKR